MMDFNGEDAGDQFDEDFLKAIRNSLEESKSSSPPNTGSNFAPEPMDHAGDEGIISEEEQLRWAMKQSNIQASIKNEICQNSLEEKNYLHPPPNLAHSNLTGASKNSAGNEVLMSEEEQLKWAIEQSRIEAEQKAPVENKDDDDLQILKDTMPMGIPDADKTGSRTVNRETRY